MESNTLNHHGIKGQKWGIRRYQNKDGTLTAAGRKRYDEEMERLKKEEKILKNKQRTKAQLDKLEAKRKEIEEQKKTMDGKKQTETTEREIPAENVRKSVGKKKIKDMSDAELKAIVDRLDLERKYKDAMANSGSKVEDGRNFVQKFKEDIVVPAAKAGAKNAIQNMSRDATAYVGVKLGEAIRDYVNSSQSVKKKKQ